MPADLPANAISVIAPHYLPSGCFFQIDGVVSLRDSKPSVCDRKKFSSVAIVIPRTPAIGYTSLAPRVVVGGAHHFCPENGAIHHGRTWHPHRHRFLLLAALGRGHLHIAVSSRRLRWPPCRAGRSRRARRHRARDRCRRAGSDRRARGVRAGPGVAPARCDRIGLRGPSRARSLFCDIYTLRLGFGIRRMASGLCELWGNGSWRHRLAKTFRNATTCQRRQSASPGTVMEVGYPPHS